jgi:RNA polymerase sigma factor (sigma-70 family)
LPDHPAKMLAVLEDHGTSLYGLLVRLTLREDVAEDLMQELFVKLSLSTGFARASDPAAYAQRSAMNLAFNWRRQTRRKRLSGITQSELLADTHISPLLRLVHAEQVRQALDAVEQLPQLSRQVVVMRYI